MNITEANAVANLLRFAAIPGRRRLDKADAERLFDNARFLCERVDKALMAGPRPDDIEQGLRRQLGGGLS
jgi:hypothetical protein